MYHVKVFSFFFGPMPLEDAMFLCAYYNLVMGKGSAQIIGLEQRNCD
jgi:hypothetical protein